MVNVQTIWVCTDQRDFGTGIRKDLWCHGRACTVSGVDDHFHAVQPVRKRFQEVNDVAVFGVREPANATYVCADGAQRRLAQLGLNACLLRVGEFIATAG